MLLIKRDTALYVRRLGAPLKRGQRILRVFPEYEWNFLFSHFQICLQSGPTDPTIFEPDFVGSQASSQEQAFSVLTILVSLLVFGFGLSRLLACIAELRKIFAESQDAKRGLREYHFLSNKHLLFKICCLNSQVAYRILSAIC